MILHVLPTFGVGGVQDRTVQIIDGLGNTFSHQIIALNGDLSCAGRLSGAGKVEFLDVPRREKQLIRSICAAYLQIRRVRPDLLITYNWGSIEWAFANSLGPICPHIHSEDGFGLEEAEHQLKRRILFRRLALRRAERLVVPSQALVRTAIDIWKLSPHRVTHIPNGIDCDRFLDCRATYSQRFPRSAERKLVVGTVAPLRPEKNIEFLLEVFKDLKAPIDTKLVIAGDGSERVRLERKASCLGIEEKVRFLGSVETVKDVLASFDVFALTSHTEQMPLSILQAMSAALPIVTVDVGDLRLMLPRASQRFIVRKEDKQAFVTALRSLLSDAPLRSHLGDENRQYVAEHFRLKDMIAAYRRIFGCVLRSPQGSQLNIDPADWSDPQAER